MPHRGQRSICLVGVYSWEAALTPLVKVSLAMFSLSFSRSYTILIMPSTVMVSFVTTRRHSGYAVASSVWKAGPFILLVGAPLRMPCSS